MDGQRSAAQRSIHFEDVRERLPGGGFEGIPTCVLLNTIDCLHNEQVTAELRFNVGFSGTLILTRVLVPKFGVSVSFS